MDSAPDSAAAPASAATFDLNATATEMEVPSSGDAQQPVAVDGQAAPMVVDGVQYTTLPGGKLHFHSYLFAMVIDLLVFSCLFFV